MSATPHQNTTITPSRVEDLRLITGRGQYVHDICHDGMLHAVFVRSPHAHARLAAVDIRAALAAAEVRAVFVASDLPGTCIPPINPIAPATNPWPSPLLAGEAVRSVGQPIALVVARSRAAAEAAAELVEIEYADLPAAGDLTPGAAAVVRFKHKSGAPADPAAAGSLRVVVRHRQPRLAAAPMETRAAVARWDGCLLTVWLPSQSPARARDDIARMLGLAAPQVRVITPDVGGAFGARASVNPEDLMVAFAAHRLGGSIKWESSRGDEFTSATHGRGASLAGALTIDGKGRFMHLEARLDFPLGAWLPFSAAMPARNAARILPGPYGVAGIDIVAQGSMSNAAAVNIYRGAGRPEATILIERLIDAAASASGIDPVELRRRNLISPDAMPYTTPTGECFDSGDFSLALTRACARFGYDEERSAQARRRAAGELLGIGVALYVDPCGQGWESARVTLRQDGSVLVASGSAAQGQGHRTSYAVIAAAALGCAPAAVSVVDGDTAACPDGIGALASRSIAIGGSAVLEAARAAAARRAAGEALPLTAESIYHTPGEAWSYGCVICRLAIDRETGQPRIERMVWVDDAATVISPMLAEGQLQGGLAQGVGQALLERIVYDERGQLLTGSLLDYALPRAADMPLLELESLCIPTTANALGAKGVGEAGTIGVPASLLNAAIDALSPRGVTDLDFPLTVERLWRTINRSTTEQPP